MKTISVVVPCFNEEANIPELVNRVLLTFQKMGVDGEIILVDDGSSDATYKVASGISKQNGDKVVALQLSCNQGMATAWRYGIDKASGEFIVLIDADLQYQPEDIARLFSEYSRTRADVVQGFRSSIGRLRDSRYVLSKTLNLILNGVFNMRLRDNKSGFILAKKEYLLDIFTTRFTYKNFQTFLLVSAHAKGFQISEIEVLFASRLVGKSFIPKLPIKLIFEVFIDLIYAVYEFRFSDKKTTILSSILSSAHINDRSPKRGALKNFLLQIYFYTMPLHAWMISRNVKTYFMELNQSQWMTRDQITELQNLKLKKLIVHAYDHVPYYRKLLDENNLHPSQINCIEDLAGLPLLTKATITENLNYGIMSDNHDKQKVQQIVTSGSTGTPFVCFADKFQLEMRWAATLRSMEWTGYVFGDRCARLWHQTIGMSKIQVVKEFIDAFLSRRIFIPAYSISSNKLDKFMKKLQKFNPVLIDGYAESFNFLAEYLGSGKKVYLNPKAVISSAQILPDQSRKIIEENFHTKVYDKYGSREFSGIAYESGVKNEHLIVAENYIVEILKNNRKAEPGEIGEVVVTDLNNYCLPFIRYKIGDLAVAIDPKKISKCGRGLPMMGRVEGRVQAIIIGANNRYIPGTFFAHFFKEFPHVIKQYQVIQDRLGEITLKIIKGARYTEIQMLEICKLLKEHLGNETIINLEFVDSIQMVRTGKHQGAISNLKIDFQNSEVN